jgi:hypothetical protein
MLPLVREEPDVPVYTFHIQARAPRAPATIPVELPSDLAAIRHAHQLISSHPGADSVTISEDQRHVVHIPVSGTSASVAATMGAVQSAKASIAASLALLRDHERTD